MQRCETFLRAGRNISLSNKLIHPSTCSLILPQGQGSPNTGFCETRAYIENPQGNVTASLHYFHVLKLRLSLICWVLCL